MRRIILGNAERTRAASVCSEYPLRVVRRRNSPRAIPEVAKPQADQLDRVLGGNKYSKTLLQTLGIGAPFRAARGVSDLVDYALARRGRRGSPDVSRLLVPQVQSLADAVRHRIVRPGGESILSAIHGPREAPTRLGDERTEMLVGEHVAPGRRGCFAGGQVDHVLGAIGAESSITIVELEVRRQLEEVR